MSPALGGHLRPWIGLALLLSLALCGCGFGVPLRGTTDVTQHAGRSATLEPGRSSRQDVRAALGEPWLASDAWGFEIYRADDERTEALFMLAVIWPVPIGWGSEKRQGYVLVTYAGTDRATHIAAGSASRGLLASDGAKWMTIKAGEISVVLDPVLNRRRLSILADRGRLDEYLAARRQTPGCTIVAGCDGTGGCPDQFSVDGGEVCNPAPIDALCEPDRPCPAGSPWGPGRRIEGKDIVSLPVLHAIGVPAGLHELRVTNSRSKGEGTASFACAAGDVVYVTIRTDVVRARGRRTLQATVVPSATAPEAWTGYNLVLFRDDRWLVDR